MSLPTFDDKKKTCFKVPIIDDDKVEGIERFSVLLESEAATVPNVLFQPRKVFVYIVDDDIGTGYLYCHMLNIRPTVPCMYVLYVSFKYH